MDFTVTEIMAMVAVGSLAIKVGNMLIDYAVAKAKSNKSDESYTTSGSRYDHQETHRTQTKIIEEIRNMGVRQDKLIELTREEMATNKSQYDAINNKMDLMHQSLAKKEDIERMEERRRQEQAFSYQKSNQNPKT